jgi:outer membrane protein
MRHGLLILTILLLKVHNATGQETASPSTPVLSIAKLPAIDSTEPRHLRPTGTAPQQSDLRLKAPQITPHPPRPIQSLSKETPSSAETQNAAPQNLETIQFAWQLSSQINASSQARLERVAAAEHGLLAARAERLPTLQFWGGAMLSDNERSIRTQPTPANGLLIPYQPQDQAAAGLLGNLPLYQGGKVKSLVSAAENLRNAEDQSVAAFQQELRLVVAAEFLQVLRAEAELVAANAQGESSLELVRDAQWKHETGQTDRAEYMRLQAELAQAEYRIRLAELSLKQARMVYNQRLGRDPMFPCQLQMPSLPEEPYDAQRMTTHAMQQRPELAGILFESQALDAQSNSHKAKVRPQIHAGGGMMSDTNPFQSPNDLAVGYLTVTWQLYDAGRSQHQAKELKHQAASKRLEHQQLMDDIQVRVWQSCHELEAGWARYTAEQAVAAAQQERYRKAEILYRQDQITLAQKLEQKRALAEAQLRVALSQLQILEMDFKVKREAYLLR